MKVNAQPAKIYKLESLRHTIVSTVGSYKYSFNFLLLADCLKTLVANT
jgi:hypothetical protein